MATSKSNKKITAKQKAAAGKKHKVGTFLGITVQNAVPTPDPAGATTSQLITFTNKDAVPYLLQLFATDGTPAMVEVLLTAGGQGSNGGTCNLVAGASAGSCSYNILPWPAAAKPSATGGGTHKITISAGAAAKARAATAS